MTIHDKVSEIMSNTIIELMRAADEFNYDANSVVEYGAKVLATIIEIATFQVDTNKGQ